MQRQQAPNEAGMNPSMGLPGGAPIGLPSNGPMPGSDSMGPPGNGLMGMPGGGPMPGSDFLGAPAGGSMPGNDLNGLNGPPMPFPAGGAPYGVDSATYGSDGAPYAGNSAPYSGEDLDPRISQFLETNRLPTDAASSAFSNEQQSIQQQQLQQQLLMLQQRQLGMAPSMSNQIPPPMNEAYSSMDRDAMANTIPNAISNADPDAPPTDYQQKMDKMQFQADLPMAGNDLRLGGPVASALTQYGDPNTDPDGETSAKMGKLTYSGPNGLNGSPTGMGSLTSMGSLAGMTDPAAESIQRRLKHIEPSQLLQQSGLYANNAGPAIPPLQQRNGLGYQANSHLWPGRQFTGAAWGHNRAANAMPAMQSPLGNPMG